MSDQKTLIRVSRAKQCREPGGSARGPSILLGSPLRVLQNDKAECEAWLSDG